MLLLDSKEVSFMQERQSRMDKYFDASEEEMDSYTGEIKIVSSRVQKNQQLYKDVGDLDIVDFDLNSNVSILGDNTSNIDLSDIQEKLNMKYHEDRTSKGLGTNDDTPLPKINLDETREYDINSILAKAKEEKEVDYEEDRLKKLRNTQYDILSNLNLPEKKKEETVENSEEKKLLDLIDTITAKELIKNEDQLEVDGDMDPLDILSDLRGNDENTRVMGAVSLEENKPSINPDDYEDESNTSISLDELLKNKEIQDQIQKNEESSDEVIEPEEDTKEIPSKKNQERKELEETKTTEITKKDEPFFTGTTKFSQDDFDDFDDLKDDMKISKIIVRFLIFLLIVAFIVGLVIFANNYFNLGLF